MCATMVIIWSKCLSWLADGMRRKDCTGESGTRQMEMEAFYLAAGDADCILYIGQLGGKPKTLSQLIERNTLLADFKAVQNGRVYCTGADYFQQAGRLGDLIEDMNRMLSGDDAALNHIMKLE